MHSTVIEYNNLPWYTILYECNGRIKSFEGTLKVIYIISLQDFTTDFYQFVFKKAFLLVDDVVIASGYYEISQYLDDELSEIIRKDKNEI